MTWWAADNKEGGRTLMVNVGLKACYPRGDDEVRRLD